ncbi:MAG: hypothetical protein GF364_11310 [Candidatus Lokiarchaeota archaeon]|nr:hypothetical protein [Candidatus Lokiarchaeota archaeon]
MPIHNSLTFMFFTPHSDDIELGTPFVYLNAIRRGYNVIEVIMTNNQFGTTRKEFKGERLRKIRVKELANANTMFEQGTNNKVKTIYMGYVDGTLPLNNQSIQRVADLIKKERPDVIFTCDPWYAQDFHADHLNTGRCVYFALTRLKSSEMPKKVLYYYSTSTDYYIKCDWRDFPIVSNALYEHKSQYSPLEVKFVIAFYNKLSLLRHLLERRSVSESFREQKIENNRPVPPENFNEMNLYKRLIFYSFSTVTIWGSMNLITATPEEIGLENEFDLTDKLREHDPRYNLRKK